MNIIEAYIKNENQFIVLVSGIGGCGKKHVAKKLAEWLKIDYINQGDYHRDDYDKMVTLPDGSEYVNMADDDAIDWDKLSNDVKNKKVAIVAGVAFPDDKLSFKADFHIHVSIPKKICLEKRLKGMRDSESYNEQLEVYKFNHYVFPYYLEVNKRSTINKFINYAKFEDIDKVADNAYDTLMELVDKYHAAKSGNMSYVSDVGNKTKIDTNVSLSWSSGEEHALSSTSDQIMTSSSESLSSKTEGSEYNGPIGPLIIYRGNNFNPQERFNPQISLSGGGNVTFQSAGQSVQSLSLAMAIGRDCDVECGYENGKVYLKENNKGEFDKLNGPVDVHIISGGGKEMLKINNALDMLKNTNTKMIRC